MQPERSEAAPRRVPPPNLPSRFMVDVFRAHEDWLCPADGWEALARQLINDVLVHCVDRDGRPQCPWSGATFTWAPNTENVPCALSYDRRLIFVAMRCDFPAHPSMSNEAQIVTVMEAVAGGLDGVASGGGDGGGGGTAGDAKEARVEEVARNMLARPADNLQLAMAADPALHAAFDAAGVASGDRASAVSWVPAVDLQVSRCVTLDAEASEWTDDQRYAMSKLQPTMVSFQMRLLLESGVECELSRAPLCAGWWGRRSNLELPALLKRRDFTQAHFSLKWKEGVGAEATGAWVVDCSNTGWVAQPLGGQGEGHDWTRARLLRCFLDSPLRAVAELRTTARAQAARDELARLYY